jgi:hypothetical protein
MADPLRPALRAVGPNDVPPVRRRGPGFAVIAIVAYAVLFMGALWVFKSRSKEERPQPAAVTSAPTRAALLEGAGLADADRKRYLAGLAADRCDCGCEMTLLSCLARDLSCTRSPEIARERLQEFAGRGPSRASAP